MRYIGNKTKLLGVIQEFFASKNILNNDFVFCDAFCGTASVSSHFKKYYRKVIANDNLYFSYVMAQARLNAKSGCLFEKLEGNPFDLLNINDDNYKGGFVFENYAPSKGGRMFFSDGNARKIDSIRNTIDQWFGEGKITEREKYYLVASLLESVSLVSNVAGVYGACFSYIVLSYSSDGIISVDFIESLLKRYGIDGSFDLKRIQYKRYKNAIANDKENFEYLFFIEKKQRCEVIYSSPLNYIGGKSDLIPFLKNNMPCNISTFYDLFGGGFNVGINSDSNSVVYNDTNFIVKGLIEHICKSDVSTFISDVEKVIMKNGLSKNAKDEYVSFRGKYNSIKLESRSYTDLFVLVLFGFQQQIRFNSNYDYNNPVGMAGYNDRIKEKLVSFSNHAKTKNIKYFSDDFEIFYDMITSEDFVYIDPPYLITLGSYNDGRRGFNGWDEKEEIRLLNFINRLSAKGVRFMLSNVLIHNGKENSILRQWIYDNGYNVISLDYSIRSKRNEIIVVNY
ncbi:MAG: Dam family site-specific DNA-(adenine-N6)-methyltransferase [Bacteroidales bacterium]|nr:Dam family site-specific DNA-(adenine-N6)-methyltransferase [Bacteroidales bacterium]